MPTPLIIGILLLALLLCGAALRAYRRWQTRRHEVEAMSPQEVDARVERFVGEPLWPEGQATERDPRIQEDFEDVAAIQHDIWSSWMRWMFSVCVPQLDGSLTIPVALVERWERQMHTDYAQLTEQEKESDREQADKVLGVIWRGLDKVRGD